VLALTIDVRDLHQRVLALEARFTALESRFSSMEARIGGLEERMNRLIALGLHIAERMRSLEERETPRE
jgi:uncharacterized coiled-coil protein SlyX